MIRFPNPGSDISQLINIFKLLYANLSNAEHFNLNNMADIMAAENVASSSGYIGAQALEKSYEHKDFSRNPLYNQAKMYAEVYRFMGWIVSNENSALQFHFTFLGVHIATAGVYSGKLFEQCLLGITYPNQILDVKFNDRNKPFVSIMKAVSKLDGEICRDEILIGPMNLNNGYDASELLKLSEKIIEIRASKDYSNLQSELQNLSTVLGINLNTMKNYTRFVISSLVFSGWLTKEDSNVYGIKKGFLKITKKGLNLVNQLEKSESIDGNELHKQSADVVKSISKLGFIQMLERAGFVVEEELSSMDIEIQTALDLYGKKDIFFSPYQFFNKENLANILPEYALNEGDEVIDFSIKSSNPNVYKPKIGNFGAPILSRDKNKNKTKELLLSFIADINENIDEAVKQIEIEVIKMTQSDFYPFVSELFEIIFGLKTRTPQPGVNNERFDVIILDDENSTPVEAKSPREELMLSVKAVRQALENKVVLESRFQEQYPSSKRMCTLAVGFNLPNERSDIHKLIEDIYHVYGINVAITDVKTLIKSALYCIVNDKCYPISNLLNVRGIIKYEDI